MDPIMDVSLPYPADPKKDQQHSHSDKPRHMSKAEKKRAAKAARKAANRSRAAGHTRGGNGADASSQKDTYDPLALAQAERNASTGKRLSKKQVRAA